MELEKQFLSGFLEDLNANRIILPTLPEVAMRVRKLVQDPNVTTAQVEKLINMDMALSARLLGGLGTWIARQPGLDFSVLPAGDRIVYRHDQESDGVVELFLGFLPRGREHAAQR